MKKVWIVTFTRQVKTEVCVDADSEIEAREMFKELEYYDETDLDAQDLEIISVKICE